MEALTGTQLKEILNRHGFYFTKSLGQNFLTDQKILNKICDDADLTKEDIVLEIGPGAGTLTRVMAQRCKKVVSVEIDAKLIPVLEETLVNIDNSKIINADFLKLDLAQLYKSELCENFKVVANLPYYITTPIIMRILQSNLPFCSITVLVQREVGERMAAKSGGKDYGALSCAVQFYADVKMQTKIGPGNFYPPPKVESRVITIIRDKTPKVKVKNNEHFFKTVHCAFAMRRKTLSNNLMHGFNITKEQAEQALSFCGLDLKIRGEQLSLEQFAKLSDYILLNFYKV